ncbi:MAG: response regulator, partial [Pseudomonadales bacterium]|nr:response regulator [Pseudomonadales bacterium]
KALIQESQGQSEALKIQQEELKSTNETLISQTLELKASEEELKQQSEELKVSNEELQSKQQALVNQKEVLKKAETELLANADKLMQSSQYKSDFLANMSHELRTPLNSLLILSKLLADNREGNLTQGQLEDAKMIHEGGQDLLNLIGDIMDMSKVEAGKLTIIDEEVQLDDVLENLDGMFSSIAKEKQVAFNCQLDTGMPQFIVTDEQRLLQILKNFLSNAFKFTSKGSVSIKVQRPQAAMQFMHEDLNANNTIAFSVTDTGIGIEDNKQKAIFEAFQQADGSTSRKYGGTGLGLSISTKLASLLGGEIGLYSETDKGSTFTLYLPSQKTLCQDDELQTVKALETVEAQASNELFISDDRDNLSELENTVLIIEDDVKFAKFLLQIARDMKFKGIVTNRGRDGLYLAMNYPLQGILIDAGLSDIDGTLVLEHLQHSSHTRDIPVHVISGRNGKQTYLNRGAKSFLCKPAAQDDIESIFRALAESKNKQVTVLLIEDDQKQQKAISRLLESKQLSLLCVSTGEAAFERLNNQVIDGIILDLGLDDMDGQAILKKLHETAAWRDIPVVIHTGQEISAEQHMKLSALSMDIIIKGSESPERLLADVSLFFDNINKQTVKQNKPIAVFHDSEAMLKGRRILLVDDDMRNVFALSKVLGNSGLIVTMADNGQTALDKLSEADGNNRLKASAADPAQAPIELIIMDIMMPVMDGYEAMRRIRKMKAYADIPIIALTAKAMHEDLEKCMAAGASEYITKPVDIEQLMSMLNIWLYKTHEK